MTASILWAFVVVLLATQNTDPGPGIWDILEQTDPITDTRTITATLSFNTHPTIPFTIRCRLEPEGTPQLDFFMLWDGRHWASLAALKKFAAVTIRFGKLKATGGLWRAEPLRFKGRRMTGTFHIPGKSEEDSTHFFISRMGQYSIFAAQFDGAEGEPVAVWDTEVPHRPRTGTIQPEKRDVWEQQLSNSGLGSAMKSGGRNLPAPRAPAWFF